MQGNQTSLDEISDSELTSTSDSSGSSHLHGSSPTSDLQQDHHQLQLQHQEGGGPAGWQHTFQPHGTTSSQNYHLLQQAAQASTDHALQQLRQQLHNLQLSSAPNANTGGYTNHSTCALGLMAGMADSLPTQQQLPADMLRADLAGNAELFVRQLLDNFLSRALPVHLRMALVHVAVINGTWPPCRRYTPQASPFGSYYYTWGNTGATLTQLYQPGLFLEVYKAGDGAEGDAQAMWASRLYVSLADLANYMLVLAVWPQGLHQVEPQGTVVQLDVPGRV